MRFALMIEPPQGLDYRRQLELARHAEQAGFDTLYRSDHYQSTPGPEGRHTTDAWAVTAGLVRETEVIRHGILVSPVTFRHPANLAKMVATIDEMSGGRVELGLGVGWHTSEHRQNGFALPDLATRVEILEEQLQVINGLWCEPAGWSFAGSHYQVDGARFVPPPIQQPRVPIILGTRGAGVMIRLAARYADELNLYYCTPEAAQIAFTRLDEACRAIGRDPAAVRRSVLLGTAIGATEAEVETRLADVRRVFEFEGSRADWVADLGALWLYGTPSQAEATVRRYEAAGADRIVMQDFLFDDSAMVDLLGELARAWG